MPTQYEITSPAALFKEYYARLCYFAFQFTADKDKARDIAQEAFVTYIQSQHLSSHPSAIRNFLYSTVRNACLNAIRHEKVVEKYASNSVQSEIDDTSIMLTMIQSEVMGEIYRAIETLPDACRQIIRMGYLEGLKNPEIADKLSISVNTVKTQKKRGIEMLKKRLNPEIFGFFFF
ncbi:RNA polymerase sigma-70 factor [Chitinophaga silvatica]|uniref:RNA polymerase sigma-70 factor n=1 Tax=Chitinophaga silvatica TaxID=2282649 RepID=A0A3E1Y3Q8_9BACT|nr:RNA polymerase sigma-70 factor [Chitinophaga silvatica]RFS19308.1 RNA polymerase sigma-70 factor [Chitinophaga silvatica]